jgi:uncharacterized protein YecE (DUF72 family)
MTARIRIGCSGWEYGHWRGDFYPADLPKRAWLERYAEVFDTVELNNSFYRLPTDDAFAAWARRVPDGFAMAVKASRYLTHFKRLRDPREPLERLWARALQLGDHLGPVLYQLPPRWERNRDRLATFLDAVPVGRDQAVEFRDPSWYHQETYDLLAAHRMALCLHDMGGSATGPHPVGPFVYLRLHGSGSRYGGRYSSRVLERWADHLVGWAADGRRAWVYFNNDGGGHAPRDALRLRDAVSRLARNEQAVGP